MNNNPMMPYNMMPLPGSQAYPGMGVFPGNNQMIPGGYPNNQESCHEQINKIERDLNRLERQVRRLEEKVNNLSQIPMPINAKDNLNQYPNNNMYMM